MHDGSTTPILTAEREVALIRDARAGCASAKSELLTSHARLVRSVARRLTPRPTEDTIAEGMLGLVEAFERFDPTFGVRFSTYAAHWIRALVTRHVRTSRRAVAPPDTRAARRVLAGLGRVERKLAATDPSPGFERIAIELGVEVADVAEVVLARRASDVSIGPRQDGGPDVDPPADASSPEELVASAEEAAQRARLLADALALLPPRERRIVEARCCAETCPTLEALGEELDISRERVRQLERRALERLGTQIAREEARGETANGRDRRGHGRKRHEPTKMHAAA